MDTTYPQVAPTATPRATSGVRVDSVALAQSSDATRPINLVGGILLTTGGLLMAAAALSLRRRGKHSL